MKINDILDNYGNLQIYLNKIRAQKPKKKKKSRKVEKTSEPSKGTRLDIKA